MRWVLVSVPEVLLYVRHDLDQENFRVIFEVLMSCIQNDGHIAILFRTDAVIQYKHIVIVV